MHDDGGVTREIESLAHAVVRHHRRFALTDVTIDGGGVGGATVDAWQDETGAACWSARILMPLAHGQSSGNLVGVTRDGRIVRGRVSLGAQASGPRSRSVLAEWHGVGPLVEGSTDPGR